MEKLKTAAVAAATLKTCKAPGCGRKYATGTGAKDHCPTCYQRERRVAKGVGKLRAGEKASPSLLSVPGAREMRATCAPALVKAIEKLVKRRGMIEADFVREGLEFYVTSPRAAGGPPAELVDGTSKRRRSR